MLKKKMKKVKSLKDLQQLMETLGAKKKLAAGGPAGQLMPALVDGHIQI